MYLRVIEEMRVKRERDAVLEGDQSRLLEEQR